MGSLLLMLLAGVLQGTGDSNQSENWIRNQHVPGEHVVLEIASRRYEGPEGTEVPTVWLVGVTHIGLGQYYQDLSELLGESDVVLYESVIPQGALPPQGETEEERIEATKSALDFLELLANRCRSVTGELPDSQDAFRRCIQDLDGRFAAWARNASTDAWGRPVVLEIDEQQFLQILSLGPDGERGTVDDLEVRIRPLTHDIEQEPPSRNLQAMLAEALGLQFQLESMEYDLEHWRVSDMTLEALEKAFELRGIDFGEIGDILFGSSLPAQLIRAMLALIPIGDALSDGAVSDAIRVVLIEMLGTPGILNVAEVQYGKAFFEVIVEERNSVPLVDLDRIISTEPDIDSVAILYGAAHMPDMAARLVSSEHGYALAETRWDNAMDVQLNQSSLTEDELKSIRRTIRLALVSVKRKARLAREAEETESSTD